MAWKAHQPQTPMNALTKIDNNASQLTDSSLVVQAASSIPRDPRALRILAKSIYRELRQGGLVEEDVLSVAGELLGLVTSEVKDRQHKGASAK